MGGWPPKPLGGDPGEKCLPVARSALYLQNTGRETGYIAPPGIGKEGE